jgi:hypothetical protein
LGACLGNFASIAPHFCRLASDATAPGMARLGNPEGILCSHGESIHKITYHRDQGNFLIAMVK